MGDAPVASGTGRSRPALVLAVALVGISFSGPLVRLSNADPLVIATWRLGFSMAIITAILAATGGWRRWAALGARDLLVAIGAGAMLALHFWSWNASIGYTTIAASVVLVNLNPVIVALLSGPLLGERPTGRQWIGITVAMAGALAIAAADFGGGFDLRNPNALMGDILALVGAVTVALYFMAGRRLRATLDLWPYVGLVYGACFVVLVVLSLASGARLGAQPPRELAIFAALALGPMLLGHTGLNWALRYLPAFVVTLTVLGEPVGATILAALLPGIREVPPLATIGGGALVLTGIALAMPWRRGPPAGLQSEAGRE